MVAEAETEAVVTEAAMAVDRVAEMEGRREVVYSAKKVVTVAAMAQVMGLELKAEAEPKVEARMAMVMGVEVRFFRKSSTARRASTWVDASCLCTLIRLGLTKMSFTLSSWMSSWISSSALFTLAYRSSPLISDTLGLGGTSIRLI